MFQIENFWLKPHETGFHFQPLEPQKCWQVLRHHLENKMTGTKKDTQESHTNGCMDFLIYQEPTRIDSLGLSFQIKWWLSM